MRAARASGLCLRFARGKAYKVGTHPDRLDGHAWAGLTEIDDCDNPVSIVAGIRSSWPQPPPRFFLSGRSCCKFPNGPRSERTTSPRHQRVGTMERAHGGFYVLVF